MQDMNVFGNAGRSGYKDIVSYGPPWWPDWLEMDANYRYAGWTVDLMAYQLDRVINNLFPRHADEKTIRKMEKLFKIIYDEAASLDERRRVIEAYFSGGDKLSRTMIQNTVRSYTGAESEVWWIGNELNVRILGSEDVSYSDGKLADIINRRMPGHLPLKIRDVLCKFELKESFGVSMEHRIFFVFWDRRWDGTARWDGEWLWDAEYPTVFRPKYTYESVNEEDAEVSRARFRAESDNGEQFEPVPGSRIESFWYEGRRMFNDRETFDGRGMWDADMPPELAGASYRASIDVGEDFIVQMVKKAGGLYFDGSEVFDGSFTWNEGKEIL